MPFDAMSDDPATSPPPIGDNSRLGARTWKGECDECGEAFVSSRPHAEFCCNHCRRTFNNRRALRGAELYDLLMALRYDRETAKTLKVWRAFCRLAAMFRAEDKADREGRKSWRHPKKIIERRPYIVATVVGRNVGGGRRHTNG